MRLVDFQGLPTPEALIGLAGAPITLLLTHYLMLPLPRIPKSATSILAVIVGILWNLAAIAYTHGDLAKAPALGALSGLAASGLKHGIVWRERRPVENESAKGADECR